MSDGIQTTFHEEDDKLIVKNSYDAQSLIDRNTAIRNDNLGKGQNMRLAASIPLHMLFELQSIWKAQGLDEKVELKKWLNDPDNRAFRTSNDRI